MAPPPGSQGREFDYKIPVHPLQTELKPDPAANWDTWTQKTWVVKGGSQDRLRFAQEAKGLIIGIKKVFDEGKSSQVLVDPVSAPEVHNRVAIEGVEQIGLIAAQKLPEL